MTTPQEQGSRRGRQPKAPPVPVANQAQQAQGEPALVDATEPSFTTANEEPATVQDDLDVGLSTSDPFPSQSDNSTLLNPLTKAEEAPSPDQEQKDATEPTVTSLNEEPVPAQDDLDVGLSASDPLIMKVSNSGYTVLEMRSKVSLVANQLTIITAKDERDRLLILKNLEQLNHLSGYRHLTVGD